MQFFPLCLSCVVRRLQGVGIRLIGPVSDCADDALFLPCHQRAGGGGGCHGGTGELPSLRFDGVAQPADGICDQREASRLGMQTT